MTRLRLTPWRAAAFVIGAVALSYPATWVAWTGWPWSPLRFAAVVVALWAFATLPSRPRLVAVLIVLVLLCPLVAIHVADDPEWSTKPSGRAVAAAIGAREAVRWHGVPVGWVSLSTRDKAYVNGEGSYADRDLVATAVTLLPWSSIRREHVIGLGGNSIDFWVDDPQLRRDSSGLLVTSTRYHTGGGGAWERRRIGLGASLDLLASAAWAAAALVLVRRSLRSPGKIVPTAPGSSARATNRTT